MSAFLSMRSRHFWLSAERRERGRICVMSEVRSNDGALLALCLCKHCRLCAVLLCRPIFARTDELNVLPLDAFALILRLLS